MRPRDLAALAITGALAGCGGSGHPATGPSAHTPCRDFHFDRTAWRRGPDGREGQARALVGCRTLAGETPGAVLRRLGPPDSDYHEGYLTYSLAAGNGGRELVVAFDSSHHVRTVRITRV